VYLVDLVPCTNQPLIRNISPLFLNANNTTWLAASSELASDGQSKLSCVSYAGELEREKALNVMEVCPPFR